MQYIYKRNLKLQTIRQITSLFLQVINQNLGQKIIYFLQNFENKGKKVTK